MGLITAMLSPMIGHYFTFMTPAAFVRRPGRWIREMARKPDDTGGVISVAPNFAFEHAAARGLPKDGEPPLDLSNVKCILNGSEPISAAIDAQVQRGVRARTASKPQAIKPSYGLAEATLFVSTTPMDESPEDHLRRPRRAEHRHASSRCPTMRPSAVAQAVRGQGRRRRVGRHRRRRDRPPSCPTDRSARSGCSGQNMGTGYWGKEEETSETFQNILKSRTNPSHAEGATDDATWVRTGDYGAYHDGDLYITGRVKDLVIIDGRNHYPQDLEYSAQEATQGAAHRLRRGVLGARQPAARRGVRQRARRPQARPRRHLRAAGDRRRARARRAQAGL